MGEEKSKKDPNKPGKGDNPKNARPVKIQIHKQDEISSFGSTYKEHFLSLEKMMDSIGKNLEINAFDAYSWIFNFDDENYDLNHTQFKMEPPVEMKEISKGRMEPIKTRKPNPIIYSMEPVPGKSETGEVLQGRYAILFKDTWKQRLSEAQRRPFAITNLLAYYGKKNLLDSAGLAYGVTIDLDGITGERLGAFLGSAMAYDDLYPLPNIVALSGTGVHLYYVFTSPVELTLKMKKWLKWLKYNLIACIWNQHTSVLPNRQYQGINQGFRPFGGQTKVEGLKVLAYLVNEKKWDLFGNNSLESFINSATRNIVRNKMVCPPLPEIADNMSFEDRLTFDKAEILYPEWAEAVKEEKKTGVPRKIKGWKASEHLYAFWIDQIKQWAVVGVRYWSIYTLAIIAAKCDMPFKRLQKDADELQKRFDALGAGFNPFTKQDESDALKAYDEPNAKKFSFQYLCTQAGIEYIPKGKNTPYLDAWYRNKETEAFLSGEEYAKEPMTREKWLEIYARPKSMAAWKKKPKKDWRKGNGRKSQRDAVEAWIRKNPYGKKYICMKETGLSKNTVRKWWANCGGLDNAKEIVEKWKKENPDGKIEDCIKEVGLTKKTVCKFFMNEQEK